VIDAFCKISVTGGKNPVVTKKMCENVGVVNILESGGDDTDDWIDTENNRVLVASVRSEAGRQGVLKGDVVTHFNGELFDGTAADLDAVIKAQAERSGNGMFTLVLNAESSVAEALRRRSMI
jgi:enoyl reductase-like protein